MIHLIILGLIFFLINFIFDLYWPSRSAKINFSTEFGTVSILISLISFAIGIILFKKNKKEDLGLFSSLITFFLWLFYTWIHLFNSIILLIRDIPNFVGFQAPFFHITNDFSFQLYQIFLLLGIIGIGINRKGFSDMSKKLKIFIRTFIEKLPREFYVSGLLSILITSVIIVIFSILNFAIIIVLLSSLVLNILISYPILSKLIKKQYFGINSEKLNIVRDSVLFGNLLSFGVIVVVNLMYIALYSNIPSGETYYWYLRDVTVNSLFSAMVYLEIALGITLVYKILKFANFTQAEYVTFGAYMAFLFGYLAENNGFWSIFDAFSVLKWIPIFIILCVIAFISTAVVGIIFDFIIFKPLRQKDAKPASMMIASFGLGLALRIVIQQIFSAQPLPVSLYFVTIQVDSILLRILIILFVLFSTWFFQLALYTTKLGKIMRAVSDNEDLAKISGVKPYQIHIMVWIISAGFAGVAGVLATSYSVGAPLIDPYIGFGLLLGAFAVTVLGGIGSFEGVVLASLIVGFTENMGAIFLSEFSELNFRFDFPLLGSDFYILPNLTSMLINFSFSTGYKIVLPFAILIIVLLIKPYGLLGEQPSGDR